MQAAATDAAPSPIRRLLGLRFPPLLLPTMPASDGPILFSPGVVAWHTAQWPAKTLCPVVALPAATALDELPRTVASTRAAERECSLISPFLLHPRGEPCAPAGAGLRTRIIGVLALQAQLSRVKTTEPATADLRLSMHPLGAEPISGIPAQSGRNCRLANADLSRQRFHPLFPRGAAGCRRFGLGAVGAAQAAQSRAEAVHVDVDDGCGE